MVFDKVVNISSVYRPVVRTIAKLYDDVIEHDMLEQLETQTIRADTRRRRRRHDR
jgi:hypothetical protein